MDSSGAVLRSVATPWVNVAGELRSGDLVCRHGLLSWDGVLSPLPWEGEPVAVLAGRCVLLAESHAGPPTWMRLHDVEAATEVTYELPDGASLHSETYDAAATRVAFTQYNQPWVVVAGVTSGMRVFDVGFDQHSATWLDGDQLLLIGNHGRVRLDVRSGARSPQEGLPRGAYPRIHVTGRFDVELLKAARRPRFTGPIPADIRDREIAEDKERLLNAAAHAGVSATVIERSLPAVRLRSCLAPSRTPIGTSRFGGRPDLPNGHAWPRHDGVPMAFLAQLRCDELAAALPNDDLPGNGLLVVFTAVDPDDGAVFGDAIHAEVVPAEDLKRRAWPGALPEQARFTISVAAAEPMVSPPNRWDIPEITDDQADLLQDAIRVPGSMHQVLGHLNTVQDVSLSPKRRPLLRLDSDPLNGTMYGDGGSLWITIPAGIQLLDALPCADLLIDST